MKFIQMSTNKNRKKICTPEEAQEGDIPLVIALIRFHQKERARRSRHIVQRRAKKLTEVRDHVLRRRLEKGQSLDFMVNDEDPPDVISKDGWERTLKSDAILEALVRQIRSRANHTANAEAIEERVIESIDVEEDRGEEFGKGSLTTTKKKKMTKKKVDPTLFAETGTAVLKKKGLEDDLAKLYAEPHYPSRFRIYRDITRRTCGGKVWTWEDLMNREPIGDEKKDNTTSTFGFTHGLRGWGSKGAKRTLYRPKTGSTARARKVSLPNFPIPKKVTPDTLKTIYEDVRDEEREQELKFLELEVRMTPFIVQSGILDSDPEFTAELEKDIIDAATAYRDFEKKKTRLKEAAVKEEQRKKAGDEGEKKVKEDKEVDHVPQATRLRAERRAMLEKRRRQKQRELQLNWDDDDEEDFYKGVDDMLCFDPTSRRFLPPQAMLQRAIERQRDAEDLARFRERRRQMREERRQAKKGGCLKGSRSKGLSVPHPSRETYSTRTSTKRTQRTNETGSGMDKYGYTSPDEDVPPLPYDGIITSKNPKEQMIPLEGGGYCRSISTCSSSCSPTPRSSLRTRSLSSHRQSHSDHTSHASSCTDLTLSTDKKKFLDLAFNYSTRQGTYRRDTPRFQRDYNISSSDDEDWNPLSSPSRRSEDSDSKRITLPPIASNSNRNKAFPGSSVIAKPTYLPSARNYD